MILSVCPVQFMKKQKPQTLLTLNENFWCMKFISSDLAYTVLTQYYAYGKSILSVLNRSLCNSCKYQCCPQADVLSFNPTGANWTVSDVVVLQRNLRRCFYSGTAQSIGGSWLGFCCPPFPFHPWFRNVGEYTYRIIASSFSAVKVVAFPIPVSDIRRSLVCIHKLLVSLRVKILEDSQSIPWSPQNSRTISTVSTAAKSPELFKMGGVLLHPGFELPSALPIGESTGVS